MGGKAAELAIETAPGVAGAAMSTIASYKIFAQLAFQRPDGNICK